MEIKGNVIEVTNKYIRLQTIRKKQLVDVYFPESKRVSLNRLFEPRMFAKLEVEIEGFNIETSYFARLWVLYVISPEYSEPEFMRSDAMQFLFDERKKLYRKLPE